MPGNCVVIVAAGRGERMAGPQGPKQYRDLAGASVLARSVAAFCNHRQIDRVIVVIHPDDLALYAAAVPGHARLLPPVFGGANRQASVLCGLEALQSANPAFVPDFVLVHDAARPMVGAATISAVLDAIKPGRGAIAASPVADALKLANPDLTIAQTIPRDALHAAQTPQGFVFSEILAAHRAAAGKAVSGLSDDAAVAQAAGMAVVLVPAPSANFKITLESDLQIARQMLGSFLPDVRTGNGYDVHQLEPGDHVTLCGVKIPHNRSLKGHSDADVGLHALTDALLGTIGDGDIGSHFPPGDMQWKGVSSDRFLAHAMRLVRAKGGQVTHLDVSLVCEEPRIGPHREAMRQRIAQIAGIAVERVAVKATTNEKIGFVGRGEGIAAIATATVVILGPAK